MPAPAVSVQMRENSASMSAGLTPICCPLKRFFVGAATNKETGEQIPWEKVKKALLEMVHHEDKHSPLSDEELEGKLQASGYPVKRRTVTKYRKLLNIPSSRERKEWVS